MKLTSLRNMALKPSTDVAAGLTPAVLAGMAHGGAAPLMLSLGGASRMAALPARSVLPERLAHAAFVSLN